MDKKETDGRRGRLSNIKQNMILVICFFESVIFGGAYFGWASMGFILIQDGVYSHLCGNHSNHYLITHDVMHNNTDVRGNQTLWDASVSLTKRVGKACPEQDTQLSLAFMIGFVLFGLGALPSGLLFDRFGLWALRTISWVFAVVGYSFLAFADDVLSWIVFPGCALVAISTNIIVLTGCHICELAGKRKALCVTIYNGGLTASTIAYLLLKIGYENGIPRRNILLTYIAALTVIPITTFTLLPRYKVTSSVTYEVCVHDDLEIKVPQEQEVQVSESPPGGVKDLIRTTLYGSLVFWLATMHVRGGAFIGFYNGWLTQLVNGDMAQVSHYVNVLGIVQTCGFILSPSAGILIDWQRKAKTDLNLKGLYKAILALPSVTIATVAAILMSIFVLIPEVNILYLSILTSEVVRSTAYASALATLNMCYPTEHFGVLFGGMYFSLGLATILQVPYTIIAECYGFTSVNGWLLFTAVMTLLLPIVIIVRHVRRGTI